MKIKVTRSFLMAGKSVPIGTVLDVADSKLARQLIRNNKAFAMPESAPTSEQMAAKDLNAASAPVAKPKKV